MRISSLKSSLRTVRGMILEKIREKLLPQSVKPLDMITVCVFQKPLIAVAVKQ